MNVGEKRDKGWQDIISRVEDEQEHARLLGLPPYEQTQAYGLKPQKARHEQGIVRALVRFVQSVFLVRNEKKAGRE